MNLTIEKKEELMRLVMQEADEAIREGNSPFGAILVDKDGNFNEEYTNDGLHPNDKGYEVITEVMKEYMKKVNNE